MLIQTELLLQDCAYEGYDGLLVDLSVGLDCFSNLGSIAKFDRISKLNRMREVLEELKQDQ
jgi:enolase